jgi:hypothetical protein
MRPKYYEREGRVYVSEIVKPKWVVEEEECDKECEGVRVWK